MTDGFGKGQNMYAVDWGTRIGGESVIIGDGLQGASFEWATLCIGSVHRMMP